MAIVLGNPFEWAASAACQGADRDLFFPIRNDAEKIKKAKAYCKGCPCRPDCLGYALSNPEIEGVWGDTTKRERDLMRGIYGSGLGSLMTSLASNSG